MISSFKSSENLGTYWNIVYALQFQNIQKAINIYRCPALTFFLGEHEMHEMMQDLIAAHEKRQVKIADCVFDSGLTALFLGRGGMESKITSFSPEKDELDLMICKDVEAMQ